MAFLLGHTDLNTLFSQTSERHQGERVKEQGEADQGAVRKRSQDETSHCREGGAQSLERIDDFYVKF